MTRIFFTIITVVFTLNSASQTEDLPKFDFDDYRFPKSVVIDVKSKNKNELKASIQNWLDSHFTETSLIESNYTEDTFTITAIEERLLKVKNLTSDLKYRLNISIRDQKYRLEISSIRYKYYTEYRPIANLNLIKDEIIKNDLINSQSTLSSFFQDLNLELFSYISSTTEDW